MKENEDSQTYVKGSDLMRNGVTSRPVENKSKFKVEFVVHEKTWCLLQPKEQ